MCGILTFSVGLGSEDMTELLELVDLSHLLSQKQSSSVMTLLKETRHFCNELITRDRIKWRTVHWPT